MICGKTKMQDNNNSYIAVIAAAGLSKRMGLFKPLLDLGGKPALLHLIDSIVTSGIGTIIIVTGHEHEAVVKALDLYTSSCALKEKNGAENTIYRLLTMNNEDYEAGMFSSVKEGIRGISEMLKNADFIGKSHKASLLFLADVPLVSTETINGLIRKWEDSVVSTFCVDGKSISESCEDSSQIDVGPCNFAAPAFKGKNGHPLLIPKSHYDEILSYTGEGGIKAIRNTYIESMIIYETNDAGCVLDMDTLNDYEELKKYLHEKEDNGQARGCNDS
jgi:CTP:molybdopterin cytidylyltransferase MocA